MGAMSEGEGLRPAELLQLAALSGEPSGGDLATVLQSVTDVGTRLTGAQYGAFFYSGEDEQGQRLDVYALSGEPPASFPREVPVRHTALFAPTFAGQAEVRVDDLLTDPRYGSRGPGGLPPHHVPVRSYLAVPVVTPDERVLGALLFGHREPGRFGERAGLAARAVAAHAAAAAENARLYGAMRRAREEAERSAERLALLQGITSLLSTASSTAEIAARVPAALTRTLGSVGCSLYLLDAAAGALVGVPSPTLPAASRAVLAHLPLDRPTPPTEAVRTRHGVVVPRGGLAAYPSLAALDWSDTGTLVALPVLDRLRAPLGALVLRWREDEVVAPGLGDAVGQLLLAVAEQLGQALERSRLFDAEHEARAQLGASVTALTDLARTLQSGLLPQRLPTLERVATAVRYQPAVAGAEVGGDWYDVIAHGDTATFVIGDVQGHSTTAAGLMGQLRTAVRAYVTEGHDPATALARTNALLVQMDVELFATCCLLQLDQATGEVVVATAGHPAPLLLAGDGPVGELDVVPGLPLGIDEDGTYALTTARLDGRSRVLLYTDGVVESSTADIETGLAAVRGAASEGRGLDAEALADRVLAGIPHRLADDAALLLLDYAGPLRRRAEVAVELPADLRAVSEARRATAGTLGQWGIDGDLLDSALLVVSELVTNAVLHTGEPCRLVLAREQDGRVLRIEVHDDSTRHPSPREASDDALGGRGLAIVEALAQDWGVSPQGEGKAVWADLRT
ncbi:SpoIIE family protein phosphatase [Vallicoccus soli]|nr:SpoIIE family protein phosphatase [Vallicoccus soli]